MTTAAVGFVCISVIFSAGFVSGCWWVASRRKSREEEAFTAGVIHGASIATQTERRGPVQAVENEDAIDWTRVQA